MFGNIKEHLKQTADGCGQADTCYRITLLNQHIHIYKTARSTVLRQWWL